MIIFKTTDRIPVKMGEVTLWLSPMEFGQKVAIQGAVKMKSGAEITDGFKVALLTLKFCVKEIQGLFNSDGSPFECEFEEGGNVLTDACANDLLQMDSAKSLIRACNSLSEAASTAEIEGVIFDLKGVKSVKKK